MPTHSAKNNSPQALDWALWALIIMFGGSAFVMIRASLETIAPVHIAVGRIWIGAITLYIIMRMAGRRFPPLLQKVRGRWTLRRSWRYMAAVGLVGNIAPFLLFPWAQQQVDSGLAGVYMAFMPIWTLFLAALFAGEAITGNKIIGFLLGFVGIIILMGADVLTGVGDTSILAQAGLLLATLCYAGSTVITRIAPPIRPRIFASGMMILAAIVATPLAFLAPIELDKISLTSALGVFGLGLLPTGINGVLIIILVRRAGAGFMALGNYVTPLWAVLMGALIYDERLAFNVFIALGVILAGVAISRREGRVLNFLNHQ